MYEYKKSPSFFTRIVKSKAFYGIAVALVLLVAVGSWAAINMSGNNVDDKNITTNPNLRTTSPSKQANAPADVTDDRNTTEGTTGEAAAGYESNVPYESFYMMPAGTNMIKDFSNGSLIYNSTMGDYRVHNGVDFKMNEGEPVKAINSGIVLDVYTDAFWGVVVEINHGGGLTAKYCGLTSGSTIAKGTVVELGDTIGTLGIVPCEQNDGPHLHLEITVNGDIVDPLKAMNKDSASGE